jgi:DNA modification methylase
LPTAPAEKELFDWQQPVGPARYLVERMTPPDGLVVDPMLGVGSFGLAALESGRRFVGVELDADRFRTAKERLEL